MRQSRSLTVARGIDQNMRGVKVSGFAEEFLEGDDLSVVETKLRISAA